MWTDPIVADIRQHSEQYAAQFDFELAAIFRDLKKKQQRSGREAVSLPPKRLQKQVRGKLQREEIAPSSHRPGGSA